MSLTTATGRWLFSFIFIASAVNKWQALSAGPDAALMSSVTPALRLMKATINAKTGFDLCSLLPSDYALVRVTTTLELLGASLFAAGFAIGAKFLILFLLIVTPVMHPFWVHTSEAAIGDEAALGVEMIMFFKNVALLGALVTFLGERASHAATRETLKATIKRD